MMVNRPDTQNFGQSLLTPNSAKARSIAFFPWLMPLMSFETMGVSG